MRKQQAGVYKSIMQGLQEAVEYQKGTKTARTAKLSIKPVPNFKAKEIRNIRQSVGMSQTMFAGLFGVSPKTVEAWEGGRNQPKGPSRRLLEIARDEPTILERFQKENG